jgi:hypothetical protein
LIMVPVLLTLVPNSSTNRLGECMKVLRRLKEIFRPRRQHSATCTDDCEHRADQRLHDQATRLHVLEWEAGYHGPRKKRTQE